VNAKRIVKRTPKANRRRGKTDWAQADAVRDREIEAAIKSDPDAAPLLDGNWFKHATVVMPERKVPSRSGLIGRWWNGSRPLAAGINRG
jgi:hypothetical protein